MDDRYVFCNGVIAWDKDTGFEIGPVLVYRAIVVDEEQSPGVDIRAQRWL